MLDLSNNSISGIIPPNICSLHKLQILSLFNNSIGGEIPPNISSCSNLISLAVHNNRLVGTIPPGIGSLLNLNLLALANNNLTGIIPPSLANLTSLSWLYIYENELSGTIPDGLGKLEKLTILAVAVNKLSGTVPLSIFNLSSLDLGLNRLEGTLPLDFGTMLPNLQVFSLLGNQFTGSIPPSISNSSNLVSLQLSTNHLTGHVPSLNKLEKLRRFFVQFNHLGIGQNADLDFVSSLGNATMLEAFAIASNNLGGIFPSTICNFSMLSYLGLDNNDITGQIPSCIENLVSLSVLALGNNQLSGAIPLGIGRLKSLGIISVHHNQLSGSIPSSIGNLTQLIQIFFVANKLEGHIPSTLGNCSNLQELDLSQNNLNGGIPPQLLSLSSLSIGLDLSDNPLTGSLPFEVAKLTNLDYFSVSNTMLSGEISSAFGSCVYLEYLNMGRNFFLGAIPPTWSNLGGLRELDLSQNNLSGRIPQFLARFPLQILNLSYNNFEGEVPIGGVFSNVTGLSISGNKQLCGGIPELKLPPCNFDKAGRKRSGHGGRLIISILSGAFGVILLAVFVSLCAFCYRKKRKEPETKPEINSLPNLSYQSLLKATNGFSSENLIGRGTFGVVYKGNLDQDQTAVTIEVFNLDHRAASKTFLAECQVLKNVRHRNLVKVITACSSVDHQGNDFKALVYEYMVNGTLEDWLHQKPTNGVEGSSDAPRNLYLLERLDLAVDVAFAIEYLYHHSGASIVHCDLKPSNVLLSEEMVAHVGDFGLAKFLCNGVTSSRANQSSSMGVRGTIGYAPPEYGMGNEPSTYGDVYSFGILLLEMLTGRRPTDGMFKEGLNLRGFVKAAIPEHVMEILDQSLLKDIIGEEMGTLDYAPPLRSRGRIMMILEAFTSVLGIALSCSAELPQERLDMSDVAPKLSSIKNKLLLELIRKADRGET